MVEIEEIVEKLRAAENAVSDNKKRLADLVRDTISPVTTPKIVPVKDCKFLQTIRYKDLRNWTPLQATDSDEEWAKEIHARVLVANDPIKLLCQIVANKNMSLRDGSKLKRSHTTIFSKVPKDVVDKLKLLLGELYQKPAETGIMRKVAYSLIEKHNRKL